MGILDRFRQSRRVEAVHSFDPFPEETNDLRIRLLGGRSDLNVVGESYRQRELWSLVGGTTTNRVRTEIVALLVPEPENPYDPYAVGVFIDRLLIGYLARDMAEKITPGLQRLYAESPGKFVGLKGVIAGGGIRGDGLGNLGVFLKFNPADFGLVKSSSGSQIEKGPTRAPIRVEAAISLAEVTDANVFQWIEQQGYDPIKKLRRLQDGLTGIQDPVCRHVVMADLERMLYSYRDDLPSALDEYDKVAEQHHAELLAGMRDALVERTGLLTVQTYGQSVIRHTKAKNYELAIEWCERGIAMFDSAGQRTEASLLQERLNKLRDRQAKSD